MWLFKTEPSDYSFVRLTREKRTLWTGVRNALALLHLRKVRKGDPILIYHTGKEKSVVGVAKALADAKDDAVAVAAARALANPVPLSAIRADPAFRDFGLVRISRLAVMPVSEAEWKAILRLAGERP
jgi:predicted RNA-binding protein with PUA-like domain